MEGYSKEITVTDRPKFAAREPDALAQTTRSSPSNSSLWLFVDSIAGYALGAHIGLFVGWLAGLVSGSSYVKYFEPAYIYEASQLSYWELLPYRVARDCAIVGIIAGVAIIKIARCKSLRRNIISLFGKAVTSLKAFAHRLAKRRRTNSIGNK